MQLKTLNFEIVLQFLSKIIVLNIRTLRLFFFENIQIIKPLCQNSVPPHHIGTLHALVEISQNVTIPLTTTCDL